MAEKAAVAVKPKKKGTWFDRIAKIATDLGETEYSADDVRTILKAWRVEYTERKKAAKAAEKEAAAKPKKKVKAAVVEEEAEEETEEEETEEEEE